MKRRSSGFTLIELMIAVAILAILAAIAIPAYEGYVTTANNTEASKEIEALKLAQEEFFLENGNYFTGVDTPTIIANAAGYWLPGKWNTADADAVNEARLNFTYTITSTDTAANYTITATGQNRVDSATVIPYTHSNQ